MKHENLHQEAVASLAALGHDARLTVFRQLVRAGEDGLRVGELVEILGLPASTLAHHLRTLVQANLVIQEKNGREVLNRPNFEVINRALGYVTSECCLGMELVRKAS